MNSFVHDMKKSVVDSKLNISENVSAQEIEDLHMGEQCMHTHRTIAGYFLTVISFLACPCHLPITLSVVTGILSGTTLGILLATNKLLTFGVFMILYIFGLLGGVYLLSSTRRSKAGACTVCDSYNHRTTRKKQ
ncbi:MAG: hypothetical protein ACE5R6_03545 [Candidatus Heimdallarchaeota archaeon]